VVARCADWVLSAGIREQGADPRFFIGVEKKNLRGIRIDSMTLRPRHRVMTPMFRLMPSRWAANRCRSSRGRARTGAITRAPTIEHPCAIS